MKVIILKIIVVLLISLFLSIGLVPNINLFLREHITYEEYFYLILGIVFVIFEIIFYLKSDKAMSKSFGMMEESINFKKYKKEKKYREDKDFYYRELPFNKDLFKIFWIAYQYGIINNRANVLNALLLKWCKEGRISFVKRGKYIINDINLDFSDCNEASLFEILKSRCKKKFVKLTLFNYNAIFKKIDDILIKETSIFRNQGKVIRYKGKDIILSSIKSDVDVVFGFRNFLLNFGNIEDKSPEEVNLWDEYLIYAELLGISDRVRKEFRKANIDYSYKETKFKRFNKRGIFFLKLLLSFSYLFYGLLFLVATGIVWSLYAGITWYRGLEYLIS